MEIEVEKIGSGTEIGAVKGTVIGKGTVTEASTSTYILSGTGTLVNLFFNKWYQCAGKKRKHNFRGHKQDLNEM